MKILVDIGGTYARFAVEEGGGPGQIKKFAAEDFPTFEDAIRKYTDDIGAKNFQLLIATAAHNNGKNQWHFVNKNKWAIDVPKLGNVAIILNDFEAATWGLIGLKEQKILKAGRENKIAPRVLIGPGTGLGLGYLIPVKDKFHVQGTLGGHLATAALNDEHRRVLQAVDRVKPRQCLNVYEDVVSGPGLYNLYAALCSLSEEEQIATDAADMLNHMKSPAVKDALRLFHEFFGMFASNVATASFGYGGMYLMGGVLDRLDEKGLFDLKHFEKFFVGNMEPSFKAALDATPIIRVTDPQMAFRGLLAASA